MPDEARLDGKVAVVTGGGRGIGRTTAMVLARAGAAVRWLFGIGIVGVVVLEAGLMSTLTPENRVWWIVTGVGALSGVTALIAYLWLLRQHRADVGQLIIARARQM